MSMMERISSFTLFVIFLSVVMISCKEKPAEDKSVQERSAQEQSIKKKPSRQMPTTFKKYKSKTRSVYACNPGIDNPDWERVCGNKTWKNQFDCNKDPCKE